MQTRSHRSPQLSPECFRPASGATERKAIAEDQEAEGNDSKKLTSR